ncbi:OmpA family protein [Marinoscillum furvescens]|nr:OmpA family protein [Marinoscillum furvescens]
MNQAFTGLIMLLLAFLPYNAFSQEYSKRAVKSTTKAEEAIRLRQFEEAKSLLRKAIETDPTYWKAHLRMATIFSVYQEQDSALSYYNRLVEVAPEKVSEKLWVRIAGMNFKAGRYQQALSAIKHVKSPDSLLVNSISFAVNAIKFQEDIVLEQLPDALNAFQLQYFPVLTVDENTLLFTKRDSDRPYSDEDIVVSSRIGGQWIPPQSISPNINTEFNEGACSISADGRTLIFTACEGRKSYGSCDLYVSYKTGNYWSVPQNLGPGVNSRYWESQPALSADGRTLYFASNRPGGIGKRDIWTSRKVGDEWQEAQNLGKPVNTVYDETTPFIHANGRSLIFSSEGHVGMGGFDLLLSQKQSGIWSTPVNLGFPVNTHHDEISMFLNASGSMAYFAKETISKQGVKRSLLVRYPLVDTLVADKSKYVTGKVMDAKTKAPIGADLRMINLMDSSDIYHVRSDSVNGKYFLVLTQGQTYGVFVKKKGYLFEDFRFETSEGQALTPDTLNILLSPIATGDQLTLENIYFGVDDYRLDPRSRAELLEIVAYLNENPAIEFEIQGHTDNQGGEAYNQTLSTKRAHSVYQFLSENGIDAKRMSYKGYGSTQPIAANTTPEGRSKNRRITFKVIFVPNH